MERRYQDSSQFHVRPATSTWTKSPASISQLPTELLFIIFKLVYATNSHSHPPFSPYTLASVCTIWRDVMSLEPEFWTHISIHLNSESFSIENISAYLERSRNLTIHVTITGNTDTSMTNELEENQRSRSVTAVLCPHIRRCETIHYDVAHSSSLPLISSDLYYSTPYLKELCLKSTARSGGCPSAGNLSPSPGVQSELCFPVLEDLTLDGWNFIELCNNNPQWDRNADRGISLSIVHFRPSPEGKFSLHSAFEYLSRIPLLHSFELHDVDFEFESDVNMDDLPDEFVDISNVSISDLSGTLTAGVLSYANISRETLERVIITRCPLAEASIIPYSCELFLRDIPTPQDICRYISSWGGSYLEVRNSPGFNDGVLEMLSTVTDPGEMTHAPYLVILELYDCTNFSIEALRRMVHARQQNQDLEKFLALTISHCVPEMSREAKNWFEAELAGFYVDGTEFCE